MRVQFLFFGRAQLLTDGLVGEYIGRTAPPVKGRPLYLADELTEFEGVPALQSSRR